VSYPVSARVVSAPNVRRRVGRPMVMDKNILLVEDNADDELL
jgi:hypothetical protein